MIQRPTTIVGWFILIIVVAACAAVMYIALAQFGIGIPPWVVNMLWVAVVAVVAIAVIQFISGQSGT